MPCEVSESWCDGAKVIHRLGGDGDFGEIVNRRGVFEFFAKPALAKTAVEQFPDRALESFFSENSLEIFGK